MRGRHCRYRGGSPQGGGEVGVDFGPRHEAASDQDVKYVRRVRGRAGRPSLSPFHVGNTDSNPVGHASFRPPREEKKIPAGALRGWDRRGLGAQGGSVRACDIDAASVVAFHCKDGVLPTIAQHELLCHLSTFSGTWSITCRVGALSWRRAARPMPPRGGVRARRVRDTGPSRRRRSRRPRTTHPREAAGSSPG
jgi:hypothetical protein